MSTTTDFSSDKYEYYQFEDGSIYRVRKDAPVVWLPTQPEPVMSWWERVWESLKARWSERCQSKPY